MIKMSYKFYIYTDTFSVLVSLLQKGLTHDARFLIYDEADSIQNRLWTFTSISFIPNVKLGDPLTKQHQVPFIISTNINSEVPAGYKPIIYQNVTQKPPVSGAIIILHSKDEIPKVMDICLAKHDECEVYIKNQNSWSTVLL